jgi:hypothetical protein
VLVARQPPENLREALDQVFSTYSQALDAVNALGHQQPVPLPDGAMAMPVPPHDLPRPAQQRAVQRQGWTAPAIAQQVGLSLRTVQRDLQTATFAGRRRRSDLSDSVLNPYNQLPLCAGPPRETRSHRRPT